jgi:two-component system alkaline phosphatase synthesis response regulator PhoP
LLKYTGNFSDFSALISPQIFVAKKLGVAGPSFSCQKITGDALKASTMKDYKILVVDDEPDILEILAYNLRKEGFLVTIASNGEEGLKKAEEIMPDLIILDIMMPQMDGVEVCRNIRSRKEFDSTLIAFLTAREEDYSQIAALDVGGDDYITKPIKPRVLMSRVKALLRRPSGKAENNQLGADIIEMGDLIIDREKVVVTREGQEIELAKKEFELLSLLVSKPGKVFTREEIFNKVWGTDVIVGNRTIDVHIRKLREKIGDDYIKTIKGIGYRFEF